MQVRNGSSGRSRTIKWTTKTVGQNAIVREKRVDPKVVRHMPTQSHPYLSSSMTEVMSIRLRKRVGRLVRRRRR